LARLSADIQEKGILELDEKTMLKVMGLHWSIFGLTKEKIEVCKQFQQGIE
jgi:hypothetical protein